MCEHQIQRISCGFRLCKPGPALSGFPSLKKRVQLSSQDPMGCSYAPDPRHLLVEPAKNWLVHLQASTITIHCIHLYSLPYNCVGNFSSFSPIKFMVNIDPQPNLLLRSTMEITREAVRSRAKPCGAHLPILQAPPPRSAFCPKHGDD